MVKLTKLQRYTAYCIMSCEVHLLTDVGSSRGLCFLWNMTIENGIVFDLDKILPELYSKKTRDGAFWFFSTEERIRALNKCIEETHS